jgi:diguanylate cyclase (GGDEF)-like protein/PAS domain S-box-containing protein
MVLAGATLLAVDLALTILHGDRLEDLLEHTVALLITLPPVMWLILDRFERRSARREHELHARQEMLLRNISDLIVVVDEAGVVRYQSPSVERALGYEPGELLGSNVENLLVAAESAPLLALVEGLEPGGMTHLECQVRQRDGRLLAVDVVATNVDGADADEGGLVLTMHDVSRWKSLQEQLTRQAFHDPLTALPNRALYIDRLDHALGRQQRHAKGIAVLFLDLDDFKTVNDSLGHGAGDRLIEDVAQRLLRSIRPGDTAARLGGDEFALLLEDVDEGQAAAVATRVLGEFEQPFDLGDRSLLVGASIGIALSSDDLLTSSDLLRAADTAMYVAKDAGKGQYRTFEPSMHRASTERLRLGADLRGAVERGELVVHYQPIVDLPGGDVAAMEALVRWQHPERGLLPPGEFIPQAERSGLIVPIGAFVVHEACRQARAWQLARPERPVGVSVNVSGVQLQHAGFVGSVSLALEEVGLNPQLLTLEITESVMAIDDEAVGRRLAQLKAIGVRIAIDDFGTGYSSLGSIGRFPIDIVKIDRSFIWALGDGQQQVTLARSIIRLAHNLKLSTVAEGVETEEQSRKLVAAGCDQAQGFLFSRPLDARQANTFLLGHTGITVWMGHWGQELAVINDVLADFETRQPAIKVEVVGGMHDDRIVDALRDGNGPNVVSSFKSGNFGTYASAGGLVDLEPYLERDGIDLEIFPEATRAYTQLGAKRWALPLLADAYGLYYNLDLFSSAGLSGPPRTMSELMAYAKRLTRRRPDGSLAVVGFFPLLDFYENSVGIFGHQFGAHWFDEDGGSALSSDPAWARMLRWQKDLVDWYGYDDLVKFREEVGEEFSSTNAFHTGRLGMLLDGEWRLAFLASTGSGVRYRTAPMPVDDIHPELYGSGFISGTIIGIRAGSGQQDESWQLIKYLATDDSALVKLSNGLRNIPSTRTALRSPDLERDANFSVFMDVFAHPKSTSAPVTAYGMAYQDVLDAFARRWQSGTVKDLGRGLREVDRQINGQARIGGAAAGHAANWKSRTAGTGDLSVAVLR